MQLLYDIHGFYYKTYTQYIISPHLDWPGLGQDQYQDFEQQQRAQGMLQ